MTRASSQSPRGCRDRLKERGPERKRTRQYRVCHEDHEEAASLHVVPQEARAAISAGAMRQPHQLSSRRHELKSAPSSDPWVRGIFTLFFRRGKVLKTPWFFRIRQIGRTSCRKRTLMKIARRTARSWNVNVLLHSRCWNTMICFTKRCRTLSWV